MMKRTAQKEEKYRETEGQKERPEERKTVGMEAVFTSTLQLHFSHINCKRSSAVFDLMDTHIHTLTHTGKGEGKKETERERERSIVYSKFGL